VLRFVAGLTDPDIFELTRVHIVTSRQTRTHISAEISHVGHSAASRQELDTLSSGAL
jgi:hypothetical protein